MHGFLQIMSLLTICVFSLYMKVYCLLYIAADLFAIVSFKLSFQTGQFAGQLLLLLDKFLLGLKFIENEYCSKQVLPMS